MPDSLVSMAIKMAKYVVDCLPKNVILAAVPRLNTYHALVYPYFTYGIILRGSTLKSHFTKLVILQNIVRSILKRNYMEHSHAPFIYIHLLKLHDIIRT